jgi:hypothetical protein
LSDNTIQQQRGAGYSPSWKCDLCRVVQLCSGFVVQLDLCDGGVLLEMWHR